MAEPVAVKPVELTSVTAGSFPGKIPLDYAYTAGIGGRKFFEDLAQGKLSGTYCPTRDEVLIPPASFCEEGLHALDPVNDAIELDPAAGHVTAATLVFEDRKGHELDVPVWIVQVEFDGATGSLFGRLEIDVEDEVVIGMPVKLVATDLVGPEHVAFQPILNRLNRLNRLDLGEIVPDGLAERSDRKNEPAGASRAGGFFWGGRGWRPDRPSGAPFSPRSALLREAPFGSSLKSALSPLGKPGESLIRTRFPSGEPGRKSSPLRTCQIANPDPFSISHSLLTCFGGQAKIVRVANEK